MHDPATGRRRDTASIIVGSDANSVWRAFADPGSLMAWLPPAQMTGRALEYDFREGGRYRIELTYHESLGAGSGKSTARTDISTGRFLSLVPGKCVVQSVEFESDDPSFAGEMRMTWAFQPLARGTRVTVTADHVPPGISREDHDAGLRGSLENLARFLA